MGPDKRHEVLGLVSLTLLLIFASAPAKATVYDLGYGAATSTVQAPSVSLMSGNVGTVSVSAAAPDAATVTVSAALYPYVPFTLTNSQTSPTAVGFQQATSFNPSLYSSYENTGLGNIRFCADPACATLLNAWLESCSPSCTSSATSAVAWVKLPSSIPANGALTIYLVLLTPTSTQFDGVYWGEAPQLSATYGQYDNGANVFSNYYRGDSSTGWTIAGAAGSTASAPAGNPAFGTRAFYANSANGDYMYTTTGITSSSSVVVQFFVLSTGLGNFFFTTTSGGAGTMTRLDTRGGASSGLALTRSWTSWNCPSTSARLAANTWYVLSVVVTGGSISDSYSASPSFSSAGTVMNALSTGYTDACGGGTETYSYKGAYVGLVGDALGSTYLTYWSGIIVRAYPPSGVMPTASAGTLVVQVQQGTVPVTITNNQPAPTPVGFQQAITFAPSGYSKYETGNLGNIRFCADSACATLLNAWLESCSPSCTPTATSATAWVKLAASVAGVGGLLTIYMSFLAGTNNFDGVYWGEAPGLSATYGQYDNGANVFVAYYRGDSAAGWSVVGAAGTTSAAPSGSASGFGTRAFYANSANGNYMDVNAGYSTTADLLIQYYTYTTGLGNLFFSASSTGAGTMSRLETRANNYAGLAATASWTSWNAPLTTTTASANTWNQWTIEIDAGTQVSDYYTTTFGLGSLGTQINAPGSTYTDSKGTETYSPAGSYIGLVGDALGSSYITYWNGILVRDNPPAGVMPSVAFGTLAQAYVLAISNSATSSWNANLIVASSSNTARLYNLTIWFYSPSTVETRLGTGVAQLTTGPALSLPASGTLYVALYASATSGGTSTVTLALKLAPATGGPYADYTIVLTVN